jgi:hypothetical protein
MGARSSDQRPPCRAQRPAVSCNFVLSSRHRSPHVRGNPKTRPRFRWAKWASDFAVVCACGSRQWTAFARSFGSVHLFGIREVCTLGSRPSGGTGKPSSCLRASLEQLLHLQPAPSTLPSSSLPVPARRPTFFWPCPGLCFPNPLHHHATAHYTALLCAVFLPAALSSLSCIPC